MSERKHPWYQKLYSAQQRCRNKNTNYYYMYGGKGIKCLLIMEDVKFLWFRDKAYLMDKPSLDRKDSNKDYTLNNCRFIEYKLNALEGSKNSGIKNSKPVDKYSLDKKFIKSFKSIGEAAESTGNYDNKYSIASCCRKDVRQNKRKLTAYGFIWRFKGEPPEW